MSNNIEVKGNEIKNKMETSGLYRALRLLKDCDLQDIPEKFTSGYRYSNGTYHYILTDKQLAINSGDNVFESSEKFWIRKIFIKVSNSSNKDFRLISDTDIEYIPVSRERVDNTERLSFNINDIVQSLSFRSEQDNIYVKTISISGVSVTSLVELNSVVASELGEIKDLRDDLIKQLEEDINTINTEKIRLEADNEKVIIESNSLNLKLSALKKEISSSDEYLNSTNNRVEELYSQQAKLIDKIKEVENKGQEIEKQNVNLEEVIKENVKIVDELIVDINLSKATLTRYKKEESLYSEDLTAYRNEITEQNNKYWATLSLIFIVISIVVFNIYSSSLSIINEFNNDPKINIINLFLSRLPLISINILVTGTCVNFASKFITKILENNREVANLKKIIFLVKEVCESQSQDLDEIPQKEILANRIKEKMTIVREYLFNKEPETIPDNNVHSNNVIELAKSITERIPKS
ncbi:coiled-coil domain-containing protein [Photobacterium swingsii]|uniref:coiled-coil domain-containing protein n=1 Tax=Photobacterium swingsii TaxID=680026 RepID=UPI00406902B9